MKMSEAAAIIRTGGRDAWHLAEGFAQARVCRAADFVQVGSRRLNIHPKEG